MNDAVNKTDKLDASIPSSGGLPLADKLGQEYGAPKGYSHNRIPSVLAPQVLKERVLVCCRKHPVPSGPCNFLYSASGLATSIVHSLICCAALTVGNLLRRFF